MKLYKISKKELIKNLLWEFVLTIGISMYYYRLYHRWMIMDSLFLSGILFISMGAFRIIMHLGLFDSTVFAFRKVWNTLHLDPTVKNKTYAEFVDEYQNHKSPWELIFPALIVLLPSIILFLLSSPE